jgi:hypothetical protein
MDEASPCRADNLASHLRLAAQRQGKETAQTRDGECCEPAAQARFLFSARVYPNPTRFFLFFYFLFSFFTKTYFRFRNLQEYTRPPRCGASGTFVQKLL